MISACVPIYNHNVKDLVNKIYHVEEFYCEYPAEINLIDDRSHHHTRMYNQPICGIFNYTKLPENVGRAKIRNLFIENSKYEYLLFLDCDVMIPSNDFLENYIKYIKETNCDVVCGGHLYGKEPSEYRLYRWKYGKKRESLPAAERNKHPHRSFMSSNFIIRKEVFEKNKFDERLTQYGHEDTLFGYNLKKNGIEVHHIDNPVNIEHYDLTPDFLVKTEESVGNLLKILKYVDYKWDFIKEVRLLKFFTIFIIFSPAVAILFLVAKPIMKYLITYGTPYLYFFDAYKYGLLCRKAVLRF